MSAQAVLALAEAADVELVVQGQALDAFIHVRNQAFIQLVQGKYIPGNQYFTRNIKCLSLLMKDLAEWLRLAIAEVLGSIPVSFGLRHSRIGGPADEEVFDKQ